MSASNATGVSPVEKPKLNADVVYRLLQDPDAFATTLLTICLVQYQDDTFKVDPLVLFSWLEEDFGSAICESGQNKLNAIITALTTDYFYNDLTVFKAICESLTSGDPGIISTDIDADDASIPEILWGIYEVSLCNDDEVVNTYNFNPAIRAYINNILLNEPFVRDGTLDPNDSNIIRDNCALLKAQLMNLGIKQLPNFPTLELDV